MQRREFLQRVGLTAPAAMAAASLAGNWAIGAAMTDMPAETVRGDMRYRQLGKTGVEVSILGVGGYHIGNPAEAEAIKIIRTAIDSGITFMDNCWDYHDGNSEVRMGKALRDGYRQKVFLMTKLDGRTKASAAKQIDESLKRLQTDHVDLMQFHENIRMEDPDRYFMPGGAHEAMEAAKKAGKIRFIGFTGHKDPSIHLRMLETAKKHNFHFDTCQMPLNLFDAHFRSFARGVVPELVKQGVGVLGMKPFASGAILKTKTVTPIECLHYAMNLPTSVVINGIESMDNLKQALEAARTFKPMSQPEVEALLKKTADVAQDGRYERFKTDIVFDGTARNPAWMGEFPKNE
ncbi:MAG: aldo/keto reductase [Gemmataceae bacterium]